MPDQIDRANDLAEQARQIALAKTRCFSPPCSRLFCEDCGEPIPEIRRQAVQGCTRCIDCQTLHEHHAKGYRK